jgi:hypothetical protein
MHRKTKELRSTYHAAHKPQQIVTLFGVEYTLRKFSAMIAASLVIAIWGWFVCLGVWYLCG